MKTNLVKTALVTFAISLALISCEKETLHDLETKKVVTEKIKPTEHNDRDWKLKEIKLPTKEEERKVTNRLNHEKMEQIKMEQIKMHQ